jgi:LuxR family maltose regulon positive regulatory protein
LIDLEVSELRFSQEELVRLIDSDISKSDIKLLWERTEGWPIACQMANYLLSEQILAPKDIEQFSGKSRELSTYFSEQVFSTLSENEQQFLLTTSVVERFTGELVNSLNRGIDAWKIIDRLERKKLFLVPLDGHGGWYRYHHLFSEYLYQKLQRQSDENVTDLHKKASKWLYSKGHVREAIQQSLAAGDTNLAAQQLDNAGGWRLTFRGQLDFVRRTLTQIPQSETELFPRLYLTSIIKLIREGNVVLARNKADLFRHKSNHFKTWNNVIIPEDVRLECIAVTDMLMNSYADVPATKIRLEKLIDHSHQVDKYDTILVGITNGCMFHQYWERGDIKSAAKVHREREIATKKERHVSAYWTIYNFINSSILDVERCRLVGANDSLQEALRVVNKNPGLDFNLNAAVSVFLAELAYLNNDCAQASTLLAPALKHLEQYDASFKHYAPAFVTLIGVNRVIADRKAVIDIIDRGYHVAETRQLPRLKTLCDIQLVRYLLLSGEFVEAEQNAHLMNLEIVALQFPSKDDLSIYLPELATLALARLKLMKGEPTQASELLEPLIKRVIRQDRMRILVEILLLKARATFQLDKPDTAIQATTEAIHIAMHEGLKRPFIDEGVEGIELFKLALKEHEKEATNQYFISYVNDLIQTSAKELKRISSRSTGLDLTDKEYEVIVEVSRGLSNKEIARLLNVSIDNVKYQLRKVYKKWGIKTREEAAKIAQDRINPEL